VDAVNPSAAKPEDSVVTPDVRRIKVTDRNLWFLERAIPLFGLLDFFPASAIGAPAVRDPERPARPKSEPLTIVTDQGWSFRTDITCDSKVFRNCSRSRGTGKWVAQANLRAGDSLVLEQIDSHTYKLYKESG